MKHRSILVIFMLSLLFLFPCRTVHGAGMEDPFPPASPESQDLDSASLRELTRIVQSFFDEGDIVGAELLIVKNRKTMLHEVFGWKDAEDRVPMERHTLCNIRSMTKPMTGTLAQMMVDGKKLDLGDPASKYLVFFKTVERSKIEGPASEHKGQVSKVTVDHLITHRSGLPLTCINQLLTEYRDLAAVAEQAASVGPDFPPGSRFQYSDAGTDVLGAVLEKAAGTSLAALFRSRIFIPLKMTDAFVRTGKSDPRWKRTGSNHLGSKGAWSRYWKPGDDPIYPFAMGSQSVYCTPRDYVR